MRKYGFEARCTGERDYLETLAASYVDEWSAAFGRADVQAGEIDAIEAPAVVAWEVLLADRGLRVLQGRRMPSFEEFKCDLDAYVIHWNTRRRQVKLKGLTPEEFRNQSSCAV